MRRRPVQNGVDNFLSSKSESIVEGKFQVLACNIYRIKKNKFKREMLRRPSYV
jgi:hypothetical protein